MAAGCRFGELVLSNIARKFFLQLLQHWHTHTPVVVHSEVLRSHMKLMFLGAATLYRTIRNHIQPLPFSFQYKRVVFAYFDPYSIVHINMTHVEDRLIWSPSRRKLNLDYASQIQPRNTDSAGVSSVSRRMMGRRLAVKCCQGMWRQLDWCKESVIV